MLGGLGGALPRAIAAEAAPAEPPLTNPAQVWMLTPEQKDVVHRIQFEGRVSYSERRWRHLWLERDGAGEYLQLSPTPPELRQGQRVRLEGTLVPNVGLEAARVHVEVLRAYEPIEPLEATARIHDLTAFTSRVVTVEAYVDGQQLNDDDHLRLSLVVADQPVTAWVKPKNPRSVPRWQGKFIRLTGLYQARFDPTATQLTVELWTADEGDVVVTGSMASSQRFNLPVTPVNEVYRAPANAELKIRGRVQASEPGASLVVRDETGQIYAQSALQQRLPYGAEVEVVGRPTLSAARWTLRSAFYRVIGPPPLDDKPELKSVDQIRQLSLEQAARGLPVEFSGVVTWSQPGGKIFFVEDITGGIRVRCPASMEAPPRNKYLHVEGVTFDGGFAPAIELRRMRDLGAMETPRVKEISYDRAITGAEDGQLVEMRGFFQRTESDGATRRIHVTTPGGEFVGLLSSAVNFSPTVGSLIRIRGACEAVVDDNGRISGILLRMGSLASVTIEADAPADFFDLPLRSVKSLRQLTTTGELMRVRVSGVVLHADPGHFIYLEQDDVGVRLLTREPAMFSPGDEIEAVGILGREGVRIELRETVARKIRSGPPPASVFVADPSRLAANLDSRLVRMHGTLIDVVDRAGGARLTLQAGKELFEAAVDDSTGAIAPDALRLGAGLELTGIYQLRFDDLRQSRSFQLRLRSPEDVAVFRPARLWTVPRALAMAGVLSGCTLLGLASVIALRRRVRRQTEQIRAQLERQARLEAELQRAARLESLGVLAGGIAHDFNNVLTIIIGHLGLVMLDGKPTAETTQSLQEISRAAGRARQLTRQLLTFAKGGDPVLAPVALAEVVKEAFELTLKNAPVRREISAPPDLWPASADKDQIVQVLQNLTRNALQAMPQGGTLRAELANVMRAAEAGSGVAAGRYLKLSLTDSGQGIAPDVLPKIFDPYFSTREKGSGLGLATVYSIVTKHHGRIEVESELGGGTTFHLWLPAATERPVDSHPPFAVTPPAAGPGADDGRQRGRILLMDDEDSIRLIGAIALRRAGFEVVGVADGQEALRQFEAARAEGRGFDLLILDLTIPGGLGGRETIECIRKTDARVPAIVSSGYSRDPVMANYASYGFQAMVPKPYEISQLTAAIEKLLGRPPA